jgi:hypothetical protein
MTLLLRAGTVTCRHENGHNDVRNARPSCKTDYDSLTIPNTIPNMTTIDRTTRRTGYFRTGTAA